MYNIQMQQTDLIGFNLDLNIERRTGDVVAMTSYPRSPWRVWWRLRGNMFLTCRDHKMTVSDRRKAPFVHRQVQIYVVSQMSIGKEGLTRKPAHIMFHVSARTHTYIIMRYLIREDTAEVTTSFQIALLLISGRYTHRGDVLVQTDWPVKCALN